jgi:glucokinase
MYIPLNLTNRNVNSEGTFRRVLAGDIGGTKSNLAVFEFQGSQFRVLKEVCLQTKDFKDANTMISSFLSGDEQLDVISLGVAGPVTGGSVHMTNLSWGMNVKDISSANNHTPVYLLNDLEATSYGLALLTPGEVHSLYEPETKVTGNIALIAPGTGLGESVLYFDGESYHPFATEGGHCDFAPRTPLDTVLFFHLSHQFGHVSWERVISGNGIVAIFDFLSVQQGREVPVLLQQALESGDKAKIITDQAASYSICQETLTLFLRYLAAESSNLALKMKATGGIFIGGGIIPKIMDKIDPVVFLENFRNCGRLSAMLSGIPIRIILNERTALLGAAYYGACK